MVKGEVYGVDSKISPEFDVIFETIKLINKQELLRTFQENPKRLKRHIAKLDVDIVAHKQGLKCMLRNNNPKEGTLKQIKMVVSRKYPNFDIKKLELETQP